MRRQHSIVALLACLLVAWRPRRRLRTHSSISGARALERRAPSAAPAWRAPAPTRADTVRAFLRARHDDTTLAELVADQGPRLRRRRARQPSVSASRASTCMAPMSGRAFPPRAICVSVVENLVSTSRALRPSQVGPDAALRAVLARYYPGAAPTCARSRQSATSRRFERRDPFSEAPTVTRVALPTRGAVLDSGYLVVTWDRDNVLRHTVVSGRGQIVHEELRTNTDSYRIFPNHPGVSPQTLVSGPGIHDRLAHWLGQPSTTTIGNNVDAYLDRDNNNVADANGRPVSATPAVCRRLERRHCADRPHQPESRGDQPVLPEQHRARPALRLRIHRERGQLPDQQLRQGRIRQRPGQRRSPGRRRHQQRELRDAARRQPAAHADVSLDGAQPRSRRRPRLGHRVPRVRPRPDVADDRQHVGAIRAARSAKG